jgi:hypothetical protein
VQVSTIVQDATAGWTYVGVLRPANNSTNARVSYVSGLAEDSFAGTYNAGMSGDGGNVASICVGYDSTTAMAGVGGANQTAQSLVTQALTKQLSLGFHFFQALEAAGVTLSFQGIHATIPGFRTGLLFDGRM